ncbi:hypothetical protein V565_031540 [Rhizoctonia solani 123E]|uniref:Uncharacterized protein n=1 Tax=Rhizoctonia solani 123E TaxID=1423351 RepID=A0A074SU21_9AGAM|nr:hypothetical protein V565_031540 [Rhizoctonia solani 123E]
MGYCTKLKLLLNKISSWWSVTKLTNGYAQCLASSCFDARCHYKVAYAKTFFSPLRELPLCEDEELETEAAELSRDEVLDPFERIKERMSEWVSRGDCAAP